MGLERAGPGIVPLPLGRERGLTILGRKKDTRRQHRDTAYEFPSRPFMVQRAKAVVTPRRFVPSILSHCQLTAK